MFCYLMYFQTLRYGASDIFNKSAFANRKLIVIIKYQNMRRILQTSSLNTKNNLILYQQ